MRRILAACGLLLLASVQIASAQSLNLIKVTSCGTANYNVPYLTVDATGTLCTAASVSASISGFAPATTGTPISATTGGVTGSLPAGAVVVATNVGTTNGAYCKLGASSTTSDQYIAPNGGWFAFTVGANTQLTCITSTSTTTVNMVGGAGLPTGTGGGGGGSGGGGAVTLASGAVASGAYSSGSIASGAYASGSIASGAYAAGAIGSGAMVDLGAIADAAATAGSTGSLSAKLRLMTTQLDTLNNNVTSSIPAGSAIIGKVGIDQTTPGTTNGVQVNAALPAGSNSIGTVGADPSKGGATPASVAINVSTATTTQLVALSGTTKIYVTSYDVIAGGTGNITLVYGTGASCGTGTTSLTGAYNLTAQAGIAKGNGVGAVLVVPAGNALCVTTSAAVQMSGSVSYQQF